MANKENKSNSGLIKKGEVRNPKGRPKGSKNKSTTALREAVTRIIEKEFEEVDNLILQLSPRDRAKFITDLLKYALPSLSSVSLEGSIDNTVTHIEVKYKTKEK